MLRPQAARLLAIDREGAGTRLLLLARDEAVVGSAEGSPLHLPDPSVTFRHATIRYARGRYHVVDLKSAQGTFVNGRRIRRRQALKHGDVIRFGGATPYRFIDPDALKRQRWRRVLRATAVIAILVAFGLVDHFEHWNLLSLTTAKQMVAWVDSHATPKPVEAPTAPIAKVASAPAPAASIARASSTPAALIARAPSTPAAVASIASVAAPVPAPAPKSSAPSSTAELAAASAPPWLERINFYRAGLGLDPIRDNPQLSAGAAAHARYLLINFGEDMRSAKPMSGDAYAETPGKSGYTTIGAAAARNLQLAWGCSSYDVTQQVDRWIEGPFHRFAVFDPDLAEAGYGEAEKEGCWVAALRLPPAPEDQQPYPRAIEFPPDRADVALDWIGLEAPDPLESCPGYSRPVGLPLTLQLGQLVDTKLTEHSLMEDGKPIESCAFDADSYRNHIHSSQVFGHWNLRDAGAVVIVPRSPLKPGAHYSVSITADGKTYAWSFTVADATTFGAIAKLPKPAPVAAALEAEPTETESLPRPPPAPRTARLKHRATPAPEAMASMSGPAEYVATVPSPSPTAEETPAAVGSSSDWLTVLNAYRTRLGVPPVEEDPKLSAGCLAHAKYLMTNYHPPFGNVGGKMHEEDQSKPSYSAAGLKAARASDVMFTPAMRTTDTQRTTRAIEVWISGPFHRPQLVNPDLKRAGFGEYCVGTYCAMVLDPISDLHLASRGYTFAHPLEVPPEGVTVKPSGFRGEWPDPLSACPGYSTDQLTITFQLGTNLPAKITDAHLTQTTGAAAGTIVDTCAYDHQTYTNPDAGTQAHARALLGAFGEVVMIVRDPLAGGETYRVAMTVNGKPYTWSFRAAR
jgi:uncharacterized protein YkwD